jgi:hypothetical protein
VRVGDYAHAPSLRVVQYRMTADELRRSLQTLRSAIYGENTNMSSSKVVKYALITSVEHPGGRLRFAGALSDRGRTGNTTDPKRALLFDSIGALLDAFAQAQFDVAMKRPSPVDPYGHTPFAMNRNPGIARITITPGSKQRKVVELGTGEVVREGFAVRGTVVSTLFYGHGGIQGTCLSDAYLFGSVADATAWVSRESDGWAIEIVGVNVEETTPETYEVELVK